MLTPEQLEKRKNHINASEIASIVGVGWDTPRDIYRQKCGLDIKQVNEKAVNRGNKLEGPMLELAADELGIEIERNKKMFIHPDEPLFSSIPDGFDSLGRVCENKHVGKNVAKRWGDTIPDYVFCQVQWQMACTGKTKALVVSNPWGDMRYDEIEFVPKFFEALAKKALAFWECVQKRQIPEYGDDEISDMMDEYNLPYEPKKSDKIIVDNDDVVMHNTMMEHLEIKKQMKSLKQWESEVKNALISRIGKDEGFQCKDVLATFKQAKDSKSINWERIALELNADQEIIDKHTVTKKGSRRLLVKKVRYKS